MARNLPQCLSKGQDATGRNYAAGMVARAAASCKPSSASYPRAISPVLAR
jgi:hypothetical protein